MDTATRTCFKCSIEQPLNDKHFATTTRPGHGGFVFECRLCAAARMATWRREHPKGAVAQVTRRRQRERATPGEFTTADHQQLIEDAQFHCQFPGCTEQHGLVADHIRPVSTLGAHHGLQNRQLLCSTHNQRKATATTDYRPMWQRLCVARDVIAALTATQQVAA